MNYLEQIIEKTSIWFFDSVEAERTFSLVLIGLSSVMAVSWIVSGIASLIGG